MRAEVTGFEVKWAHKQPSILGRDGGTYLMPLDRTPKVLVLFGKRHGKHRKQGIKA